MIEEIVSGFLIMLQDTTDSYPGVGEIIRYELSRKEFWIQSLIIGVTVSFVWFLILQIFRPRVKIVDKICKQWHAGRKKDVYVIKIINKTLFNIVNVNFDAFLMTEYYVGIKGKMNYQIDRLDVATNDYKFVSGFLTKDRKTDNNCHQIAITSDLDSLWNKPENQYIHFQVTAYHGISGRLRSKVHKFTDKKSCVLDNYDFEPGPNTRTVKIKR